MDHPVQKCRERERERREREREEREREEREERERERERERETISVWFCKIETVGESRFCLFYCTIVPKCVTRRISVTQKNVKM